MAKRSFKEGSWRADSRFRALCRVLASFTDERAVADFLRDVGTLSELQALSERFDVASRISAGQTYRQITKQTGASTTTVTRVAKFLKDGEGGYQRALQLQNHHRHASQPRGERMASMS